MCVKLSFWGIIFSNSPVGVAVRSGDLGELERARTGLRFFFFETRFFKSTRFRFEFSFISPAGLPRWGQSLDRRAATPSCSTFHDQEEMVFFRVDYYGNVHLLHLLITIYKKQQIRPFCSQKNRRCM